MFTVYVKIHNREGNFTHAYDHINDELVIDQHKLNPSVVFDTRAEAENAEAKAKKAALRMATHRWIWGVWTEPTAIA